MVSDIAPNFNQSVVETILTITDCLKALFRLSSLICKFDETLTQILQLPFQSWNLLHMLTNDRIGLSDFMAQMEGRGRARAASHSTSTQEAN